MFATNTRAPFLMAKAAHPHLKAARGRIINIGSLGGLHPWATHGHYCTSKAALHMLSKTMAKAWAPEISVNCVAPGMIVQGEVDEAYEHFARKTPMQRNGTAEDVAAAVLFFATAPHFITGQLLAVDGGLGLSVAAGVDGGLGGQKDADDGAMSGFAGVAGQLDAAAVLGDDSAADPEAESGALFALGGEEGLKEVGSDLLRNAHAVVGDRNGGAGLLLVAVCRDAAWLWRDADTHLAAGACGLGGIRNQVAEDLAQLGREGVDGDVGGQIGVDGHALVAEPALHEQKNLLKHLLQIDEDGSLGFAVEAEHGAADLGDAGQFLLGHVHELHGLFFGGAVAHEVEQVGDGVERIVDLVGDGGGEAAGDGQLFVGQQRVLGLALHGDVAEDHDDPGDAVGAVANGSAAVGDVQFGSVFANEDGMVAEADDRGSAA